MAERTIGGRNRLADISPDTFVSPLDKAAMQNIQRLPLLPLVVRKFNEVVNQLELQWMQNNPQAAQAAVEWGYWEPTKTQAGASIGVIQ